MPDLNRITLIIDSLPEGRAQVHVNIPAPLPGMRLETPAHSLAIDAVGWLGKQPAVAGFIYGMEPATERLHAAHIVLDLETLSTKPNATVISIGAVALTANGQFVAEFHESVTHASQPVRDIDQETNDWWLKQSDEAKAASFLSADSIPASEALQAFSQWVNAYADPKCVKVWGNGSSFDNVILSSLYADYSELTRPWAWWNDRDMRTVLDMHKGAKDVGPFEGIKHHALHDARHEAKQLTKVLKHVTSGAAA